MASSYSTQINKDLTKFVEHLVLQNKINHFGYAPVDSVIQELRKCDCVNDACRSLSFNSSLLSDALFKNKLIIHPRPQNNTYVFNINQMFMCVRNTIQKKHLKELGENIDFKPMFKHITVIEKSSLSDDGLKFKCAICLAPFGTQRTFYDHLNTNCIGGDMSTLSNSEISLSLKGFDIDKRVFNLSIEKPNSLKITGVYTITRLKPVIKNIIYDQSNLHIAAELFQINYRNPIFIVVDSKLMGNRKSVYYFECDMMNIEQKLSVSGLSWFKDVRTKFISLGEYEPRNEVKKIVKCSFISGCKFKNFNDIHLPQNITFNRLRKYCDDGKVLTVDNYSSILTVINEIEDYTITLFLKNVIFNNVRVNNLGDFYSIEVKEITLNMATLLEGNLIWLKPIKKTEAEKEFDPADPLGFISYIERIEEKMIVFKKVNQNKKSSPNLDFSTLYNIRFLPDRLTIRAEHCALHLLCPEQRVDQLFPKIKTNTILTPISITKWKNETVKSNKEQSLAVHQMISCPCYPAPFILFGPPGTGKTTSIVESLCQIRKFYPSKKILVCAPSNAACDEIAARAIKFLPSSDIYRQYSISMGKSLDKIDPRLVNISNLGVSERHTYPPSEYIKTFSIVIVTLSMVHKLYQIKLSTSHFSYIFIDECGSATEPSSIIPISAFGSNTKIILAGDPLQLGPVVKSRMAESLGLEISLLERLMKMPIYQRNSHDNKYDADCIIQLVQNFRSHAALIHLSNQLFYDGSLEARADVIKVAWSLSIIWKESFGHNKKKQQQKGNSIRHFPFVFHSVRGKEECDDDSPSKFNYKEVDTVIDYVKYLVGKDVYGKIIQPEDIGIISPYKKQCFKIRERLRHHPAWNSIEVGSVEIFQGQERDIIILSLVRTSNKSIGFVASPRRFNVAITRAHALLIVIGCAEALQEDIVWRSLIKYCIENNSYIGEGVKLKNLSLDIKAINKADYIPKAANLNNSFKLLALKDCEEELRKKASIRNLSKEVPRNQINNYGTGSNSDASVMLPRSDLSVNRYVPAGTSNPSNRFGNVESMMRIGPTPSAPVIDEHAWQNPYQESQRMLRSIKQIDELYRPPQPPQFPQKQSESKKRCTVS